MGIVMFPEVMYLEYGLVAEEDAEMERRIAWRSAGKAGSEFEWRDCVRVSYGNDTNSYDEDIEKD